MLCKNNQLSIAPAIVGNCSQLKYADLLNQFGLNFVIQMERGWFGNSTYFMHNENDYQDFCVKFPNKEIKVAKFIPGIVLTNNVVVGKNLIYQTKPFLQLNDDLNSDIRLARLPGSTIGNAWVDLHSLSIPQIDQIIIEIHTITQRIGEIIKQLGFRGYCGFDFLVSYDGNVYLQECNARFTASCQMISQLELKECGVSLLQLHYQEFGIDFGISVTPSEQCYQNLSGCRVVARNTQTQSVKLNLKQENGLYDINNSKFIQSEYQLNNTKTSEQLLFTAAVDRTINPDQEVLQLQTKNTNYHETIQYAWAFKKIICE